MHAVMMSSRLSHDLDLTVSVEYVGIFSVAIGLHILKSGGDKIPIINSGGDMSPPRPIPPVIYAYGYCEMLSLCVTSTLLNFFIARAIRSEKSAHANFTRTENCDGASNQEQKYNVRLCVKKKTDVNPHSSLHA